MQGEAEFHRRLCLQPTRTKLKELGNGVFELALKKGESAVLYQGEREQVVQPCDLGGQKPNAWGLKKVVFP